MSLNYDYIFSQIDKAKKKKPKHYVPWNRTAEETEKKRQDKIESTGGRVSQRRYRRNPGGKNKPETHREGTTKPYKDEEPQSNPRQGSGQQGAHSSLSNLTEEERAKKRSEAEEDSKRNKKLSPKEREAKRRRGKIQISDLEEGKSQNIVKKRRKRKRKRNRLGLLVFTSFGTKKRRKRNGGCERIIKTNSKRC